MIAFPSCIAGSFGEVVWLLMYVVEMTLLTFAPFCSAESMNTRFAETLLRNVPPDGFQCRTADSPMSAAIAAPGVAKITKVLAPLAWIAPTREMICDDVSPAV